MFGFGKKKTQLSSLMKGLHDTHCHLLPGVDDGSPDRQTSLKLLEALEEMGVEGMILTPHIMAGTYGDNDRESLGKVFSGFTYQGPIRLKLSAEHLLDEEFLRHLSSGPLTHADNHLLVEFSMRNMPVNALDSLFEITVQGYTPILAHPERYAFLQGSLRKQTLHKLLDAGCKLQLNLLSLSGWHGEGSFRISKELLREGLYDFVGTDIHAHPHLNAIRSLSIAADDARRVEKLKDNNLLLWK